MTTLSLSLSLFISMRVETLWRFDEKFDEKCLSSAARAVVGFLKTPIEKKMEKKSRAHFIFILSFIFIHQKERETNKSDDGRGVITIVVVVAGNIALPFFKRRI